jgi:hypothetical protein
LKGFNDFSVNPWVPAAPAIILVLFFVRMKAKVFDGVGLVKINFEVARA